MNPGACIICFWVEGSVLRTSSLSYFKGERNSHTQVSHPSLTIESQDGERQTPSKIEALKSDRGNENPRSSAIETLEKIVDSCFFPLGQHQPSPARPRSGTTPFSIRAATTPDLNDIADILATSFHSRTGWNRWLYPLLRLGIYEDLKHRLRSANRQYLCLVALHDISEDNDPDLSTIAGTVELTLRTAFPWSVAGFQYPYIANLAVRSESRRQGMAGQLLLTCETVAKEWGFTNIYLHVLEENHRARQLYAKLGYRLHRTETSLFGKPNRLFLHKRLSCS
jgi:ribosomal protein S18 acetylase RimI-like enzyme